MSRQDASLYLAAQAAGTDSDKLIQRALSRDMTASEAQQLITDGSSRGDHGLSSGDAPRETARASDGSEREGTSAQSISERIAVRYGYPGALPPDISLVNEAEARRLASRLTRPQTTEDAREARARKGSRRSATRHPQLP